MRIKRESAPINLGGGLARDEESGQATSGGSTPPNGSTIKRKKHTDPHGEKKKAEKTVKH